MFVFCASGSWSPMDVCDVLVRSFFSSLFFMYCKLCLGDVMNVINLVSIFMWFKLLRSSGGGHVTDHLLSMCKLPVVMVVNPLLVHYDFHLVDTIYLLTCICLRPG